MKRVWVSVFLVFVVFSGWAQDRDQWDPLDDSVSGATDLGVPTSTQQTHGPHTLSPIDPEDWYQFTVTAGESYEFFSTGDLDTVGELIAADGETVLLLADDDERGLNFRLFYEAEVAGKIYVRVFTPETELTGEYVMNYTGTSDVPGGDEWDPIDDIFTGATDLGTPTSEITTHGPHSLALDDQFDWFTLFLNQGETYRFESTGSGDTVGDLYQANGIFRIASDDNSGDASNFRLIYTPDADGVVLLRVSLNDSEGRADYTLEVQSGVEPLPAGDEWDPADNIFENATQLPIGTEEQTHGPHTLSPTDIFDWFLITLEGGNTYTLYSTGGNDLIADLFFDDGVTRVLDEDVVAEEPDFSIEFTPNTSGKYYLRVAQRSRSDATYTLHYAQTETLPEPVLDAFDPVDDTAAGATALAAPQNFEQVTDERTLSLADLTDWFLIAVEPGVTYEFWSTSLFDVEGSLIAADQITELSADDDSGTDRNFNITYTATESATLYIAVSAFDAGASLSYRLHYRTLVDPADFVDIWEPNNTSGDANSLGATPTFEKVHGSHGLTAEDTEDWFVVFLLESETYEFFTTGTGDVKAEMYLGDGTTEITTDDDSGEGANFLITLTAPLTDFYLIRVTEVTSGPARYDLHFRGLSETLPPALEPASTLTLDSLSGLEVVPGGFQALPAGEVTVGPIQPDSFTESDGVGLSLIVDEGEVATVLLPSVPVNGTSLVRALIRSSGPGAAVALAGLTLDPVPALATNIPADSALFAGGYRWHTLVLPADDSAVRPVLQAAATGTSTVQIDIETVEVYVLDAEVTVLPASLILPSQFSPVSAPNTVRPVLSLELDSPAAYTEIPGGFDSLAPAAVTVSAIPDETEQSTDDTGIIFVAAPDQVTLLQFASVEIGHGPALMRVKLRVVGNQGDVTIAALDASFDGSLATTSTNASIAPDDSYTWLPLYVSSGSGAVLPIIQVSNLGGSDSVTVYIDALEVWSLPAEGFIPVRYFLTN